jgi:hypothetical protein
VRGADTGKRYENEAGIALTEPSRSSPPDGGRKADGRRIPQVVPTTGLLWRSVFPGEKGGGLADLVAGNEGAPGEIRDRLGRAAEVELFENFGGGVGQDGRDQEADDTADFGEVVQNFVKARGLRGIFREFEGRGLIDVLVRPRDERPDRGERVLDFVLLVMGAGFRDEGCRFGLEFVRDGGDFSVAIAIEHREGTVHEIAEAVGEFGAVAGGEAGVGPVAVGADIEFARDVIAECVEAPFLNDGDGIDNVAGGFADFLAVLLPPTVNEQLFRQGEAHGFEHDRPIDRMEFENILADDVDVGGPKRNFLLEAGARGERTFFEAERFGDGGIAIRGGNRDVIHERVEPDIGDISRIERDRNSPGEARGGACDAEIFEFVVFEEAKDFVTAVGRDDEVRILFDVIDEPGLVFLEFEVVVLFDQFDDVAVNRVKFTVGQAIFFREERFLAGGIETFVFRFVEMAGGVELREDRLNDRFVAVFGGANEIVIRELEAGGETFPVLGEVVAVLLRVFALGVGGLLDLLAVFVKAREEKGLSAEGGLDAGDDVRNHLFIGMPEVGLPIYVVDGSGDVEPFRHPGATVKDGTFKSNSLRGRERR